MKIIGVIISINLAVSGVLNAQENAMQRSDQNRAASEADSADLFVLKLDPKVARYVAMMDSLDAKGVKSQGYRIQLFSASGPNSQTLARKTQSEFISMFAQVPSYTKWSSPSWVVRIGDFRTRLEALEMHQKVQEAFPASFITKDEINPNFE